jgi:hypothetical protein
MAATAAVTAAAASSNNSSSGGGSNNSNGNVRVCMACVRTGCLDLGAWYHLQVEDANTRMVPPLCAL